MDSGLGTHRSPTKLEALAIGAGAGIVGFVGIYFWTVVLATIVGGVVEEFSDVQVIVIGTIALGLGTLTGGLAYMFWSDRDWSFVDLSIPDLWDGLYMIGGIIGLLIALVLVSVVLDTLGVEAAEHGIVEQAATGDARILLLLIPASFLIIGPGEEFLFRNVVQKTLYDAFSRGQAIVLASVVFAGVHLPAYGTGADGFQEIIASLAVVFVLSLVLGWIYSRTENLIVPAFVHGAYNAILFAALYLVETGAVPA